MQSILSTRVSTTMQFGFVWFSDVLEGMEMEHWARMGQYTSNLLAPIIFADDTNLGYKDEK